MPVNLNISKGAMRMNVSLTPELEKLVDEKVKSGMYTSASEVVREGLRLLHEQEELRRIKYETLKRDIKEGIDELEKGQGIPATKVFAEMTKKAKAMKTKK
jgi:antitoxin ParD1/3/4